MGIFVSNFGLHYNNFQKLFLTCKVKFIGLKFFFFSYIYIKRACYSLKYWVSSFQKKCELASFFLDECV